MTRQRGQGTGTETPSWTATTPPTFAATPTPTHVGPLLAYVAVFGPGGELRIVDAASGGTIAIATTTHLPVPVSLALRPGSAGEVWVSGGGNFPMLVKFTGFPPVASASRQAGTYGCATRELAFRADGSTLCYVPKISGSAACEVSIVACVDPATWSGFSGQLPTPEPLWEFVAVQPSPPHKVFVNSYEDGVVWVVSASGTIIATIPVGAQPSSSACSADGQRYFVPNEGSDSVSIIDTFSHAVIATVALSAGSAPISIAMTDDGWGLVTCPGTQRLEFFDAQVSVVTGGMPYFGLAGNLVVTAGGAQRAFLFQGAQITELRRSGNSWVQWRAIPAPLAVPAHDRRLAMYRP